MPTSKFDFLKEELISFLGEKFLIREKAINNNNSVLSLLEKREGVVQMLFKNINALGNGEELYTYRINIFLPYKTLDPNSKATEIYLFLKNTLQGVNAKDIFYNLTNGEFNQFSFDLIVLEGV